MESTYFYEQQRILDSRIEEKHPEIVGKDLTEEKTLALIAEIGEMMNELPGEFKFWSNKENNIQKALQEYIDLFHFTLTIGLEIGVGSFCFKTEYEKGTSKAYEIKGIKEAFSKYLDSVFFFKCFKSEPAYGDMIIAFLAVGRQLGFTWKQIEDEYFRKNEINHKRQDEKY